MTYCHFNEEAQAVWDFVRCQRPDGTFYGSRSDVCRKGKKVGDKEDPEPGISKKKTKEVLEKATSKRPLGEVENQKKNDKLREAYVKNDQTGMIKAYDKNAELAERIRPQDPKGHMEIVSDYLQVTLSQNVSGFSVRTEVSKDSDGNVEIGYTVDGSLDAGKVKDRKDQVRVALAAKKQYQTVINSLQNGTVVVVIPNQEDGRGAAREKAYAKLGFAYNDEGDAMYGIVKDGKIVSPDIDDDFGYAEKEKEVKGKKVGVWLQIITGEGPGV
jgi:hypothetical protein